MCLNVVNTLTLHPRQKQRLTDHPCLTINTRRRVTDLVSPIVVYRRRANHSKNMIAVGYCFLPSLHDNDASPASANCSLGASIEWSAAAVRREYAASYRKVAMSPQGS